MTELATFESFILNKMLRTHLILQKVSSGKDYQSFLSYPDARAAFRAARKEYKIYCKLNKCPSLWQQVKDGEITIDESAIPPPHRASRWNH